jgi:hypothetical protein
VSFKDEQEPSRGQLESGLQGLVLP